MTKSISVYQMKFHLAVVMDHALKQEVTTSTNVYVIQVMKELCVIQPPPKLIPQFIIKQQPIFLNTLTKMLTRPM